MRSDADLVRDARAGHEEAFEQIVRRHQGVVRATSVRLCGDRSRGDDIAQSTFVTAWRRLGTYAGGSLRSWLCAIAYREFLQAKRRQRDEVEFHEADHVVVFDSSAARWADEMDLVRALADLPDDQRICVTLCVAAGLSHGEVSSLTDMPLGTVKSHVSRGVAALRLALTSENVA